MNNRRITAATGILAGAMILSGCETFRWSGYSKRPDDRAQSSRSNSTEETKPPVRDNGQDKSMFSEFPKTPAEHGEDMPEIRDWRWDERISSRSDGPKAGNVVALTKSRGV